MTAVESIVYRSVNSLLEVSRPRGGVVLLRFEGRDVGDFGKAPFEQLQQDLTQYGQIQVFIDAGDCSGASIDVSSEWAQWMSAHREQIAMMHLLCGSKFIQLTANFVRRFTGFEERMKIWTARGEFEAALQETIGRRRA